MIKRGLFIVGQEGDESGMPFYPIGMENDAQLVFPYLPHCLLLQNAILDRRRILIADFAPVPHACGNGFRAQAAAPTTATQTMLLVPMQSCMVHKSGL